MCFSGTITTQQELITQTCWKPQPRSSTHRKVTDPTGILQQFLEWDSPAQHAVSGADISARSSWKAGAAASTSPRSHIQLYNTIKSTPLYQL